MSLGQIAYIWLVTIQRLPQSIGELEPSTVGERHEGAKRSYHCRHPRHPPHVLPNMQDSAAEAIEEALS